MGILGINHNNLSIKPIEEATSKQVILFQPGKLTQRQGTMYAFEYNKKIYPLLIRSIYVIYITWIFGYTGLFSESGK